MKLKILPVYDGKESFTQSDRVHEIIEKLKVDLENFEILTLENQIHTMLDKNTVVFYFTYETGDAAKNIKKLSELEGNQIISFDFSGESPLNFLEEFQILGLVTYKAVSNWLHESPSRVYLMGQGYGIYGLKSLFSDTVFGELNAHISSENYCLFSQLTHARFQADLGSDISKYLQAAINHNLLSETQNSL
jgi:hypothetical protein